MDHAVILGLTFASLVFFALEVVRADLVALGVTLFLIFGGYVTVEEGLAGFSNPAVITVIAMFILSAGLVRAGVADRLAGLLFRAGRRGPAALTAAVMLCVGTLSAFMNNIGAVAVLLPAIFLVAERTRYPVTKLLIPLSFGSLMGGLVTVIGTPPNLLVAIALEESGHRGFGLFDFVPTGLAVLATGVAYMTIVGRHILPDHAVERDLTRQFRLQDYLTEVFIPAGSSLIGQTIGESSIRRELKLTVLRIQRAEVEASALGAAGAGAPGDALAKVEGLAMGPGPETVLLAGDRLVVEGDLTELLRAKDRGALQIYAERKFTDDELRREGAELAQAVVAPNSRLRGRSIKELDVRRRFGAIVLAVKQRGEALQVRFDALPLEVGDVLLLQGPASAIRKIAQNPDFLVVSRLDHEPRQPGKAPLAIGIMALVVLLAATGIAHISVAGLLGVLLMSVTGCVRVQQMYDAVEWRVIFLIAFMMPLGIAMDAEHSGTAAWLAQRIVSSAGPYGPHAVMACLFLFTTTVTEVMSNAAAAVLMAPIGIAIANGLGLEPYPFLMAVAIGASTTFLTPIGHQANVLVYGVGNYRFSDFARVGFGLNILIFTVTMVLVPYVWPFVPVGQAVPR